MFLFFCTVVVGYKCFFFGFVTIQTGNYWLPFPKRMCYSKLKTSRYIKHAFHCCYIHAKLFLLNVVGIKNFSPTHYFSSSSTLVRGTAEIIPSCQQGVIFLWWIHKQWGNIDILRAPIMVSITNYRYWAGYVKDFNYLIKSGIDSW